MAVPRAAVKEFLRRGVRKEVSVARARSSA